MGGWIHSSGCLDGGRVAHVRSRAFVPHVAPSARDVTSPASIYAAVGRVVSARPGLALAHGVAVVVSATAQGAMAAAAGLLAQRVASGAGGLVPLAAGGAAAACVKVLAQTAAARGETAIALQVGEDFRELALSRLGQNATGRATGRAAHEAAAAARELEGAVRGGVLGALRAAIGLVPLGGVLVWAAPGPATVGGMVLVAFGVVLGAARRRRARTDARALEEAAAMEHASDDLLRHVEAFRVFGTLPLATSLLQRAMRRAHQARTRAAGLRSLLSGANEAAAALGLLVVVALLESGTLHVEPGRLVLFVSVFFLAYRPLRDLADARGAAATGQAALSSLPGVGAPSPAHPPVDRHRVLALTLDGFGAAHAPGTLTARIAPGEIVALRGPNGAGKTSLLRALLGLDAPRGAATYGDTRLEGPPEGRPFAWVPTDHGLVHATLRENLALGGDEEAALGFLREVADAGWSETHLDETIGDAGLALSAGERTWVLLARAFGSGLPVLLVDEPTAHLDEASEGRFLAALRGLRGRRTVLFVTHRDTTAAAADRVVHLA